jgi:hypothetical protein
MPGSESSNPVAEAHAKAYRAYLRTLKESLADVDIEAVNLPTVGTLPGLGTFYTWQTWYTWYTWYTYHTLNTFNTTGTRATEASIE